MQKKIEIFTVTLLFLFGFYCALNVGIAWDNLLHIDMGNRRLKYLLSFGNDYRVTTLPSDQKFHPGFYYTLIAFLTKMFPKTYEIETLHLANYLFSISTIFGISKIASELFNKKVGKIVFLILFFYPIFFGHMAFNDKDMVLAVCHVWIFYLVIKYLKKQNIKDKSNYYVIFLGMLAAIATGIHITFLGALIPIFLFVLIEIFILKKFISKSFSKKKLYVDLIKIFLIFYFLLILFWIDTHPNIFILPINIFLEHFKLLSGEQWRGWPYNLLNGQYYLSWQVPKLHFLINLIYFLSFSG